MTRTERIEKLREAIEILKQEFVGLDKILDELRNSVSTWYITPELIDRPQIISLWGMTGTGKSSVVRRLLELLDLKSQTLFFDCGENQNSIVTKISEYLGEEDNRKLTESSGKKLVYVFDEFQHARTINESGEEVDKPNLRAIWSIVDSGILNLANSDWDSYKYTAYLDDLDGFAKLNPNIELDDCCVINPGDVKKVLENLGILYFSRGIPGFINQKRHISDNDIDDPDNKDNPYRPLNIIQDYVIRLLRKRLVADRDLNYFNSIITEMREAKKLEDLIHILYKCRPFIVAPMYINCSDSLVFIIGNLDEAFQDSSDINPDIDADMFVESTSEISINDIKEALKSRFRPEQISRFGNNIIKYPSLGSAEFKEIINRECERLCNGYLNLYGIDVTILPEFKDFLYFESVYPVQGVRPIFTSISSILTPLFSKILIYLEPKEDKGDYRVKIGLHGATNFKKSEIKAYIDYSDTICESVTIETKLGAERNPESCKTKVINSAHEAGHAIVSSYLTGNIPLQVISVSTDRGGFCITYDHERDREIENRQDIANRVCIGLAGYEAENFIFGERPEMLLCGSSSDITSTWEGFSKVAYKGGYFEPFCYSISNESKKEGIPCGISDTWLMDKIKSEFDRLRSLTQRILADNKDLLVLMTKVLSEKGGIRREEMKKFIKENYTGTLTPERIEEAKKILDYNWYSNKIEQL